MRKSITSKGTMLLLLASLVLLPHLVLSKTMTIDYVVISSSGKKPFSYGVYNVISGAKIKGAGKWPISNASFEVHSIDGIILKEPFVIQIEFLDSFQYSGNEEITLSGYFTKKQIGLPFWPKDSPESKYIGETPSPFVFGDYFIATGVLNPADLKKQFEIEIVEKRMKLYKRN